MISDRNVQTKSIRLMVLLCWTASLELDWTRKSRLLICLFVASTSQSLVDADDLATKSLSILRNHCGECHSPGGGESEWLPLDSDLSEPELRERISAGDHKSSALVARMLDTDAPMPPSDALKPDVSPTDLATLIQWIDAGALPITDVDEPARKFLGVDYKIEQIHAALSSVPSAERRYKRFFSLLNLNNQETSSIRQKDIRIAKAALAKTINSLSWKRSLVRLDVIDDESLIFSFDLRDIGWEPNKAISRPDVWRHIAAGYPYGLSHENRPADPRLRSMWKEISDWTGVNIPVLRVDWFISESLQPPLYDELLFDLVLPEIAKKPRTTKIPLPDRKTVVSMRAFNAAELENRLSVNVSRNLQSRRNVFRIGFTESFVSTGPRVLERHKSAFGAYWKSYDFKNSRLDTFVLQQQPLGPADAFVDVSKNHIFDHDGGEIIFNLPNGLQGYLLVDAKGDRILFGPEDLVSDRSPALGSTQIVNGISCIACHTSGMKRENATDEVRSGLRGLNVDARDIVDGLYAKPPAVAAAFDRDQATFLTAVRNCTNDFRSDGDPIEPVKSVVARYDTVPLTIETVAAELGIAVEVLRGDNAAWDRAGFATLSEGGTISRSSWESGNGLSLFKKAALIRRIGTPTSVTRPE